MHLMTYKTKIVLKRMSYSNNRRKMLISLILTMSHLQNFYLLAYNIYMCWSLSSTRQKHRQTIVTSQLCITWTASRSVCGINLALLLPQSQISREMHLHMVSTTYEN